MYEAKRFDNIFYCKDYLNEKEMPLENIICILRKDNGLVELLYVSEEEDADSDWY